MSVRKIVSQHIHCALFSSPPPLFSPVYLLPDRVSSFVALAECKRSLPPYVLLTVQRKQAGHSKKSSCANVCASSLTAMRPMLGRPSSPFSPAVRGSDAWNTDQTQYMRK